MILADKALLCSTREGKNTRAPGAAEEKAEAVIWQNCVSLNRISPRFWEVRLPSSNSKCREMQREAVGRGGWCLVSGANKLMYNRGKTGAS